MARTIQLASKHTTGARLEGITACQTVVGVPDCMIGLFEFFIRGTATASFQEKPAFTRTHAARTT